MKAWHFSSGTLGYGDNRKVETGQIHKCTGEPKLCNNGMHGSIKALDAISFRKGCIVSRVNITGGVIRGSDKVVGASREILWVADATDVLRKFARMCALDVVDKWNAPDVVVRFLKTGDESIRIEARRAASATSVISAAAEAANAARHAANADAYAAEAAARHAADAADAAEAAAYATAYAGRQATRNRQNKRLYRMLMELNK